MQRIGAIIVDGTEQSVDSSRPTAGGIIMNAPFQVELRPAV